MIAKFTLQCPHHGAMATVVIEQPTEMKFKCGLCGGILQHVFDTDNSGVIFGIPKLGGIACAIEDHGCQE